MSFGSQDWKAIHCELVRHARWKIGCFYWRRNLGSPEDFASLAIEKAFDGRRRWSTAEYPDLISFLKAIVDSDIYHSVISTEHRKVDGDGEFEIRDDRTAETLLIEREQMSEVFVVELRRALAGDRQALRVLRSFEEQAYKKSTIKPSWAARRCGLSVPVVRNAVKRLRRQAFALREAG